MRFRVLAPLSLTLGPESSVQVDVRVGLSTSVAVAERVTGCPSWTLDFAGMVRTGGWSTQRARLAMKAGKGAFLRPVKATLSMSQPLAPAAPSEATRKRTCTILPE